jgi:TRAP-type C4-dicarboxylate transport system permease large subunit
MGHLRGGLAHVVVVTNMIMAGMPGSGVADAAGSGAVLIPAMKKAGYGVPFAAAIVGAAGTIGPMIPSSIPFVLYGSIASAPIGRLPLGGAIPGVLMGIVLMIFVYWVLTYELAPQKILALVESAQLAQWELYLLLNVAKLILGCFMEGLAVMIMAVPILVPLLDHAGIDLVHFGLVFVLNIMIGTITPPVGTIMYLVCALARISIAEFSRGVWPFVLALVVASALVTYIPWHALWLPSLVLPAS